MKKQALVVLLISSILIPFVACTKVDDNSASESTTVSVNKDFFVLVQSDSDTLLTGLSEYGKDQETIVIPSGVEIVGQIKESTVRNVRFECDDDININNLLTSSETLETVILPANITSLNSYAMANCTALKDIVLPENITVIPSMCFSNDSSLEKVEFQGNVTEIEAQAFRMCTSLKEIEFPDSITTIGNQAFFGCSSLSTVTLPKNLKIVGSRAFTNQNSGITTIIVPEEVELESWDSAAFVQWNCPYTVKVKKGSWADIHFDEVFTGQVTKKYHL